MRFRLTQWYSHVDASFGRGGGREIGCFLLGFFVVVLYFFMFVVFVFWLLGFVLLFFLCFFFWGGGLVCVCVSFYKLFI